jgi:aryl-alcohol dehydrogenase-like predicted oxidoreductase
VFYWGTSEWTAEQIAEAHFVCEKYGLNKPVVEQCQYNLYTRDKMEIDFAKLFQSKKLGTTVWSPLASGILTGKYNEGIPEGSRFDKNPDIKHIFERYFNEQKTEKTLAGLKQFKELADELKVSMPQLALAWVIKNPDVSTAITGASSPKQL